MFKHILSRIFLFEANAGGGSGGGESTAEEKAKAEEEAKAKAKQEELDKQFAERAKRATETERKRILEELGVKDPEEAKTLLKKAREADEANKSETEKLKAQLDKANSEKEKTEADAKAKEEASLKRLLDSEIKINARTAVADKEGKVTRPAFRKEAMDEVLLLIDRTKIEQKDDTFNGVEKALSELAKAKPYLLEEKQEPRRGTPPEGRRSGSSQDDGKREPIIRSL